MSTRTVRVTVRGSFDRLTDQQRAELLAEAAEHDVMDARYTPEGHLSYDVAARPFFTFRFNDEVQRETDIPAATARAEAAAVAWLTERGLGYKQLSSHTVDLSEMPLGRRGRREAARRDG
jgi:hypothetical protein